MTLPLLAYRPTTQNHRVRDFGPAEINEDSPRIYRLEDVSTPDEMDALIWAAYRQIFSEHLILQSCRQVTLESQLKNRAITVRDFIRGLAQSDPFYRLVVAANNNYRLVDICLRRILGRAAYNRDEEIAWSIRIATRGFRGFVNELIDSDEYTETFGDNVVPYQRRRMQGRPFNLVTPRYDGNYRAKEGIGFIDWNYVLIRFYQQQAQTRRRRLAKAGDPELYRSLAQQVATQPQPTPNVRVQELDFLAKVPRRR
ncbi:MAG: phycobilisome rod-core linker polypeptide [Gloeomargarita sp. GMQP_bins_120]